MRSRRFWTLVVLAGMGGFLYQVSAAIIYFLEYPATVNIKINYNDSIPHLHRLQQQQYQVSVLFIVYTFPEMFGLILG
jgi:hypothetical protein